METFRGGGDTQTLPAVIEKGGKDAKTSHPRLAFKLIVVEKRDEVE